MNVAVRPVALVQAEGTEVEDPLTKFTAAHYLLVSLVLLPACEMK